MARGFDLIALGTGTAARTAAMCCRAAGWSVAVVDSRPFGGTCPLRGCDPKKVLVGAAEAFDHARRMAGKGIVGNVAIDWPALMDFKRTFTDPVPRKTEERFAQHGIAAFRGQARFSGPHSVMVENTELEGGHILIATGARPATLHIPGEEHLIDNEAFLALPALPKRMVMIGGGYIAAEFSHIAARAGAEVAIVQRRDRLLPRFDPDLVGWLMDRFAALGIEVRFRTTVAAIEKTSAGYHVETSSDGVVTTLAADVVVHAGGRVPDIDSLDLDRADIAVEGGRLRLNQFLQSVSNPAVYAAGDAAAHGPPLTPVAVHQGKVVALNLIEGNRHTPDYTAVPSVAFTIPPIAAVGLSEAEARKRGTKLHIAMSKASDWFTARQAAEPVYGYKVLVDEETDRVVGAHLTGPHAEETINLFAMAIRHDIPSTRLRDTILAYPTAASDIAHMLANG